MGGLKEGDFIVEVASVDVKWYTERHVNKMIRGNTSYLELKVVTPLVSIYKFFRRILHVILPVLIEINIVFTRMRLFML